MYSTKRLHMKPTHPLISTGTVFEVEKDIMNAIFSFYDTRVQAWDDCSV